MNFKCFLYGHKVNISYKNLSIEKLPQSEMTPTYVYAYLEKTKCTRCKNLIKQKELITFAPIKYCR